MISVLQRSNETCCTENIFGFLYFCTKLALDVCCQEDDVATIHWVRTEVLCDTCDLSVGSFYYAYVYVKCDFLDTIQVPCFAAYEKPGLPPLRSACMLVVKQAMPHTCCCPKIRLCDWNGPRLCHVRCLASVEHMSLSSV